MSNKKSILKKSLNIGLLSFISRILSIIKDILMVRFLGVGAVSDAFSAAFKIPNILKKPFAGGALSVAFVPTLVRFLKEDKHEESNRLISGLLIINSFIVLTICLLIFFFPKIVIFISASGFLNKPLEYSISLKLIRILIFFIFFTSISMVLSGVLQAKSYFNPIGFAPIFTNILYIIAIILSEYFNLSVYAFSFLIFLSISFQALFFLYFYFKIGLKFSLPDLETYKEIGNILIKILPCMFGISHMKINALIDERFASTLATGTYTLINIAFNFMLITFHTLGSSFALVLLPHLSGMAVNFKKKLNLNIFQTLQILIWLTIPVTLLIIFFSYDIIYTVFYKFSHNKLSLINVNITSNLLIGYSLGLIFHSINKIILNAYYSLHKVYLPAIIFLFGSLINVILNIFLIEKFDSFGIAIATSISALIQTFLLLSLLRFKLNFHFHFKKLIIFCMKYSIQLIVIGSFFYLIYNVIYYLIRNYFKEYLTNFLLKDLGLWFWVLPLIIMLFITLYKTRKIFCIKIYFLD